MTRRASDSFDSRRASVEDRHHRKHRGKHGRNPCPCKPSAPADAAITVLTTDGARHAPFRLKVTWSEVTDDLDGFPSRKIDHYVVHLQHSDNGSTWDANYRRKVVDAKDADDNDAVAAIFKGIRRNRYYRVRIRAVDKKGCKGPFSDWTSSSQPTSTMSPVTGLDKERIGPRVIEWTWNDNTDPDFDRYVITVQNSTVSDSGFSTIRTVYRKHPHFRVHVPATDKTKWWRIRVVAESTVDASGNRASSSTSTSASQDDEGDNLRSDQGTGAQIRINMDTDGKDAVVHVGQGSSPPKTKVRSGPSGNAIVTGGHFDFTAQGLLIKVGGTSTGAPNLPGSILTKGSSLWYKSPSNGWFQLTGTSSTSAP